MSKYEFNWDDFTAQDYENYKYSLSLITPEDEEDIIKEDWFEPQFFGFVRVGRLCFDLFLRLCYPVNDPKHPDDKPFLALTYDCYIGGVKGYGYSTRNHHLYEEWEQGYPYDEAEGGDFDFAHTDYESFKPQAEAELTHFIDYVMQNWKRKDIFGYEETLPSLASSALVKW